MKFFKKCSATVLAASMLMTCAATAACAHSHDYQWRYNSTQHWKECVDDGEIEEGSSAAHDFTGSSTCECGYLMGSQIDYGDHTHSYTQWGHNATQHWKECPDDKEIDGNSYAPHTYINGACECGQTEGSTDNPGGDDNTDTPAPTPGVTHTVEFVTNTTQTCASQSVSSGSTVTAPTGLTNNGKYLAGWYTSKNFAEGTLFNFSTAITKNYTLYAKWIDLNKAIKEVKSYNESLAVEWEEANPAAATVQYKPVSGGDWQTVDKELIRSYEDGARVDIVGLKAGSYTVKITPSSGTSFDIPEVAVTAYDRSGYAHFNYTNGIGAYNDDGTLKDNAVVIYVTEQNKDTVMKEACAKYDCLNMFQIPNYGGGKNWGGKDADGIGWWLNNSQYTMDNKNSNNNGRPSNTYDAVNGSKLAFKQANATHPIVIRFIGTVTTPEGCTAYDKEDEGGSVGDNGNMARMKNYKNITFEGIGEDAEIKGWGFHFIAGTDGVDGQGSSFEVRNLTFNEYPEDAVGMEGQQSGTTITAPVSRCWIHHNTFLPGRCDDPAESDKAEGDGSCDFKRGEYFTASYNYFEYCHKTNLVGSSDSSMQFNMTYHHNMWYQCGSRIPLTRHANVHFYNNYVCGDTTEKTTPYSHISKPSLSYVHSLRASCYIFTEGNYYEGSKNITEKSGGTAKGWNNMYYANIGTNTIVNATKRDQEVSNSCKNNSIDYTKFDTNPEQFYYDAQNKKSDCLLDDPVTARIRVLREVGTHGFKTRVNESMIKDSDKPSAALSIPESGLTIDIAQAAVGATVSGVKFINAKKSSGIAKGKGMLATFTVVDNTEITLKSSGSGETGCELVKSDGTVIANQISSFTGTLQPGTYFISSSQKDKDGGIAELSFKNGVTEADRIQNVIDYINAIGEVALTQECASKIEHAQSAYNALNAAQRSKVTNASTLTAAVNKYDELVVAPVISLINAIGTVDENAGDRIADAQEAYNKLNASQRAKVTNASTLTAALEQWAQFAVKSLNEQIANLVDVNTLQVGDRNAITAAKTAYERAQTAYNNLDDGKEEGETNQQAQISNYKKVTDGLAALAKLEKLFEFKDDLAAFEGTTVDGNNLAEASSLKTLYTELTAAQKAALTGDENTKYAAIEASLKDFAGRAQECTFEGKLSNTSFISASRGSKTVNYKGDPLTINATGKTYSKGMKIESDMKITITASVKSTVTFYVNASGSFKYNGKNVSSTSVNGDNVIVVTLEEGTHVFERVTGFNLYLVTLTPAA